MKKGKVELEVRRPQTRSRDGDKVPGVLVGTLKRCIVYPRSTTEDNDRGRITIDGYGVWAPAPVTVTPDSDDRVLYKGQEYEIEGAVGNWGKGLLFEIRRYGG